MTKTRAHVYVSGLVQGVFFRQNTKRQAQSRGVRGWKKTSLTDVSKQFLKAKNPLLSVDG